MIVGGAVAAAARRRSSSPAVVPVFPGMTALFAKAQKGAYFDFTDLNTLAVNPDGSGGGPAMGGTARWAVDQSGNSNHLRKTVTSVDTVQGGIATSGTGYGLFNMPGFGNFSVLAEPFSMIVTLEVLAFGSTDDRIVGSTGGGQILQGTGPGKIRLFNNYSPEVTIGLKQEVTVCGVWNGSRSSVAINDDAPIPWGSVGASMDALCLGCSTGGTPASAIRFKRLFVREGLLTALERSGVIAWAAA